jgi:hypothetical protein
MQCHRCSLVRKAPGAILATMPRRPCVVRMVRLNYCRIIRQKLYFEAVDACTQPQSPGTGQAKLSRWTFDAQSRQCRQFTYSGLRGNQNNFVTREMCETTCPGECLYKKERSAVKI